MSTGIIALRTAGVAVLLDARGPGLPSVLHWGADPGEVAPEAFGPPVPHSAIDVPVPLSLVPERVVGHRGRPGLRGSGSSPRLELAAVDGDTITARDETAGLALRSELSLDDSGVLRLRHALRNEGEAPYRLDELGCVLPVPPVATEVLDLTGRWCRERVPQRRPLGLGTWLRETRHGRTGHDAPLLTVAGTPGFGFRTGEVWGIHLGWSGDAAVWAERLPDGRGVLGAAELLGPDEVVLAPGEEYVTPWLYAVWSDAGLDGLSRALHRRQRARPSHPRTQRPVTLNTWEAVYFDHRLDRLKGLADTAARLGVERFVLDDGWFRGRRDDRAGLGDWYVDEDVWPDGLAPLIDHVRRLGMEFGLWVEPEMVNEDSDLFRAHPEWAIGAPEWRHQQVLDLADPDCFAYLLERLDALLSGHDIAYLKWDHNRDLVGAGVHAQTLAVYRLLDELRARHPGVEIESCASGGGRVDLGILERTDRVWASDTNDALERQAIQRWTGLLLPPELIGAHVGPPRAHTTGRTHDLSFRAATALFGHLGFEWDIAAASEEEQAGIAEAIAFHKRWRVLLHGGEVVRADHHDPAAFVHGVVGPDAAIFAYVQLTSSTLETPGPARLPGLDPERQFHVEAVPLAGGPFTLQRTPPAWMPAITLSGRALATSGLQMPVLGPEQALLLTLK